MRVKCDCARNEHEVEIRDDGTLDTVLTVDDWDFRFSSEGVPRGCSGPAEAWIKEIVLALCDAGELDETPPPDDDLPPLGGGRV